MLGKDGITLNLGRGYAKYLAFERSANMSRHSVLSFVREDLYEPLRERMMLGMKIGNCQLAKLYAYNALLYTSGERIKDPRLLSETKIIVIDNPKSVVKDANIVTVEDDGSDVQMILAKSMFKGFGWMTENGLSWAQYLERCRKYDHALYISGSDKAERESVTELNYQFLNTLALTEEEFRPADLPLGWDKSPESDPRHWLTKTTEIAYYNFCADAEAVGRPASYVNRLIKKPGGIVNKTFIQMMEALGYDVELRYIKREEKTK